MTGNIIDTHEHYERMAETFGDQHGDPFADPPALRQYMARWDGQPFWDSLGNVHGMTMLEIGIGTGRLARQVLERGCAQLTGVDFSAKTLVCTRKNLATYPHIELICSSAEAFVRPAAFDVVYSVLTLLHIADKETVLRNMVASLKSGGRLVLSISDDGEWLDYDRHRVQLYPDREDDYRRWLCDLGCIVAPPVTLSAPGAMLVCAVKR